jgi:hypothetical protein
MNKQRLHFLTAPCPQLSLVADLHLHVKPLPLVLRLDLAQPQSDVHEQPYELAIVACREDIDTLTLARNRAQQTGRVRRDIVAGLVPTGLTPSSPGVKRAPSLVPTK